MEHNDRGKVDKGAEDLKRKAQGTDGHPHIVPLNYLMQSFALQFYRIPYRV